MFLPDWLYALLPYLYLVIGTFTAITMDSALGIGAGIVLALTGALIWKMRVDYRRETATMWGQKKRPSASRQ